MNEGDMDDDDGESTEKDDVMGTGSGELAVEIGMR